MRPHLGPEWTGCCRRTVRREGAALLWPIVSSGAVGHFRHAETFPVHRPYRSYAGVMSTQAGPCATCRQPTHRYGHGGNPLCPACRALLPTKKTTGV